MESLAPIPVPDDATAEQCYALTGWQKDDGTFVIVEYIEVPNVADDPAEHFAVRRSHIEKIEAFGFPVIGVLHSHLPDHDDGPTDDDYDGIIEGWLGGVLKHGEVVWYTKKPLAAANS